MLNPLRLQLDWSSRRAILIFVICLISGLIGAPSTFAQSGQTKLAAPSADSTALTDSAAPTKSAALAPTTQKELKPLTRQNLGSADSEITLPKWEFGFGAAAFYLNDYPGSDQQHLRWLPLPFVVYRGDFIRTDPQGKFRGMFFNSTEIDIDASIDGSFPVDSSKNTARAGMHPLDWMGEIGPRALVHIIGHQIVNLDLSLPVRWVFSTDGTRIDDRGFDFNPELKFHHRAMFDPNGAFNLFIGAAWGTRELNRYFYDVQPAFATTDRPAYSSAPGFMYDYVGLYYMHTASSNNRLHYFGGVIKYYLGDSSNRASPLMKAIENESYYAGVILNLYRSEARESRRAIFQH